MWEGKIREEMWEFYRYFKERDQPARRSSEVPKEYRKTNKNLAVKTRAEQKPYIRNNHKNFSIRREQSSTKNINGNKNDNSNNIYDRKGSMSTQIRYYKRMETDELTNTREEKESIPIKSRMIR